MRTNQYKFLAAIIFVSSFIVGCDNDDDNSLDFSGTYIQQDQNGRPSINTVFVSTGSKDAFNVTVPSVMGANFQGAFQSKLLALNPGYTTNALGQNATEFTTLLATDVLNVKTTGTTTFFDGVNVLTGRTLADDVIDVELLLIFGGPNGTSNPGLTSDNVSTNDKQFLSAFPYLASPW